MDKDIGYYIFHNCKNKNCMFFPIYNRYTGRYYAWDFCKGCATYKKAKESLQKQ